jgi:hypothetical protein
MGLTWNEIRSRAIQFAQEWAGTSSERAEAKSFWDAFFAVFGISRRKVASFEEPVKKLGNKQGYIDLFWKGELLVEHKSKGKDLDAAYTQALDYFAGIPDDDLPKFVLVSDFARFRLYDLELSKQYEFDLSEFHLHIHLFGFMTGRKKREFKDDDPLNIKAAELMGELHDSLLEIGYTGHQLELFLVRVLFCLFAENTGIFTKQQFYDWIMNHSSEDGKNLGQQLNLLFQTLNTPQEQRMKILDEELNAFPYINGDLFAENLFVAIFNRKMRQQLINCCNFDWGGISPAIFGSLFQSVMSPDRRRNLGAHYTSEKNILKAVRGLFLDEWQQEFNKIKDNRNKLLNFHEKLGKLKFLDPACGCGNFLVITYREIRLLELEVLKILQPKDQLVLNVSLLSKIDVDCMHGIEYEEFPARIAEVAMWLIDHQMNDLYARFFGGDFLRIPLKKSATIKHANALRMKWQDLIAPKDLSYIIGNPPFIGKQLRNAQQNEDMKLVFGNEDHGILDYVTAWYIKAAQYIQGTAIKVAFVSTNSITQGEQVGALWQKMLNLGMKIFFAHRTFKWSNEAKGNANVFCVIIGFYSNGDTLFNNMGEPKQKLLYDYETPKAEPSEKVVSNINPYLLETKDIIIPSRSEPIAQVPEITFGSMPNDGGYLLFTDEEKEVFLKEEPQAQKYIRPLISAEEFLNGKNRWCLWLKDANPKELKQMPLVLERIENVKKHRQSSSREATQKLANFPALFGEIREQKGSFIVIPRVSSERRKYIPMGFFNNGVIVGDTCLFVNDATLYHFGILTSVMHMAWVKYVCGRLKSDFRYSNKLVYNNFPFPKQVSDKNLQAVKDKAQTVLDIRQKYISHPSGASLADLYDPLTMPADLLKTHQALDKAVDLCYRPQAFVSEANRVEFLFDLYDQYTVSLFAGKKKGKK